MRRALILSLSFVIAGCSASNPSEGCRGHGGVAHMSHDATHSKVPFACKDGTTGYVKL